MDILATSFSAGTAKQTNSMEHMRAQAEELESVFLNTLFSEMFASVKSDSEFGGGYAEETWSGMQSEQYAAAMAKNGGIGLADQIMRQLIGAQEQAKPQAPHNPYETS